MRDYDVIVVGAGLSGLNAAIHLEKEGLSVKVLEAADQPGGRMRTDEINGFLLDRGFQVLLTSYPEAQQVLDYDALHLKHFSPGAKVFHKERFHTLADPFRKPVAALKSTFSSITNLGDKFKILALKNRTKRLSVEDIFSQREKPTRSYLQEWNFSSKIQRTFLKPFLSGIFLDSTLNTSNRMFEFIFKMFGTGYAALPEKGMQAIPNQMANQLSHDTIEYNQKVTRIDNGLVTTEDGLTWSAKAVLLAVEAPALKKLIDYDGSMAMNSTSCLYFATDTPPAHKTFLCLNGSGKGLINSVAILSNIQKTYSPDNRALISVSIVKPNDLDKEQLLTEVRKELEQWYGSIRNWMHLKTYDIMNALPSMPKIEYPEQNETKPYKEGVFICGDHVHDPSINGALRSGRIVADAISWNLALSNGV